MINIRTAERHDAENCGRVIYKAFSSLADRHGFQSDFPSVQAGIGFATELLNRSTVRGFVAANGSRFAGCIFIDLSRPAAGIGPIAIEPSDQNNGLGRKLMEAAIHCGKTEDIDDIRLVQAAYNNTSMCLYTRLGFRVRASLAVLQGVTLRERFVGYDVRAAGESDIAACQALCLSAHGFERNGDLRAAIGEGTAMVVHHDDRLTGYTTAVGFSGHTVAQDSQSLKALIAGAPAYSGPGFLLPTENYEVFRWCLDKGLKLVMQMMYMSIGDHVQPKLPCLPSIVR